MGFNRKIINEGNKTDLPKKGTTVRVEYIDYLFDESEGANHYQGAQHVMRTMSAHKVNC